MSQTKATLYLGWDPAKKIRGARQAVRDALQTAGEFWHARYLPEHFQAGASAKYGYTPRQPGYLAHKRKAVSGAPDLVYSGKLRDACQSYMSVQATGGGVRVRMNVSACVSTNKKTPGLNYATFKRRNGMNLADEITRILPEELRTIIHYVRIQLRNFLASRTDGRSASARNAREALGRSGDHGRFRRAA